MWLTAIICGSRNGPPGIAPWSWVWQALDSFSRDKARLRHVIVGGAKGIDTLAEDWALQRETPHTVMPAAWQRLGKKAGPARNGEMLAFMRQIASSAERAVLAFPGGTGTEDMVAKALAANEVVWRCSLVGREGWRWDRV